jgi:hypothetical protein
MIRELKMKMQAWLESWAMLLTDKFFVYPVNKRIIFAETDQDCGVREQRDNACLNLE